MLSLVIFILTILIMIILFSNFQIKIVIKKKDKFEDIKLSTTGFFGLYKKSTFIPSLIFNNKGIKIHKKSIKGLRKKEHEALHILNFKEIIIHIKKMINLYKKYNFIFNQLNKNIKYKKINIFTSIGTGNNMYTALLNSILYQLIGAFYSTLKNKNLNFKGDFVIKPDFEIAKIYLDINCIFTIRIVNIIFIYLKIRLNR